MDRPTLLRFLSVLGRTVLLTSKVVRDPGADGLERLARLREATALVTEVHRLAFELSGDLDLREGN